MIFYRKVLPFDDIEMGVDLYGIIREFGSESIVDSKHVEPLIDFILNEDVLLFVVALHHLVPKGWRELPLRTSGREAHQDLCKLSACYLHMIGKEFNVNAPSCGYAGGLADVMAIDGSLFVECGTLRSDKVLLAMLAHQTLMIVPYDYGHSFSKKEVDRLGVDDNFPSLSDGMLQNEHLCSLVANARRLVLKGSIDLGFIFWPVPDAPGIKRLAAERRAQLFTHARGLV